MTDALVSLLFCFPKFQPRRPVKVRAFERNTTLTYDGKLSTRKNAHIIVSNLPVSFAIFFQNYKLSFYLLQRNHCKKLVKCLWQFFLFSRTRPIEAVSAWLKVYVKSKLSTYV